jgi:hypothetical protein
MRNRLVVLAPINLPKVTHPCLAAHDMKTRVTNGTEHGKSIHSPNKRDPAGSCHSNSGLSCPVDSLDRNETLPPSHRARSLAASLPIRDSPLALPSPANSRPKEQSIIKSSAGGKPQAPSRRLERKPAAFQTTHSTPPHPHSVAGLANWPYPPLTRGTGSVIRRSVAGEGRE